MCDKVVEETEPFMNSLVVNENTEDEFTIEGFVRSKLCTVIFYVLGLISAGLIFLLGYWYPVKRMKFTHQECSLKQASVLLIQENQGKEYFLSKVKTISLQQLKYDGWSKDFARFESNLLAEKCMKYFEHKFLRYYFNPQQNKVTELSGLDDMLQVKSIYEMSNGLRRTSWHQKLLIHGENCVKIPMKSSLVVFFELAAHPLFFFQFFSVIVWGLENYISYVVITVVFSLIALSLGTFETKRSMKKLQNMVGTSNDMFEVFLTDGNSSYVVAKSSRELVPGDVIVIPPNGMRLPCDAVLLNGRCVVNESTLTGESFPTTKTALDTLALSSSKGEVMNEIYSVNKYKRHTLYNGTDILKANFYGGDSRVLAVVVRTGFCTLKGRLIRSIIHPNPVHFTFFRDSMKLMLFVFAVASIGCIYTIVILVKQEVAAPQITLRVLDIFSMFLAVPPVLFACMSLGWMYALYRLKKFSIFCIDPARVNISAKVKLFVFDKTGTLTDDQLHVCGVVRKQKSNKCEFLENVRQIYEDEMIEAMASCHSLTSINGSMTGDPLEVCMFNFTTWKLNQPTTIFSKKFEHPIVLMAFPPTIWTNSGTLSKASANALVIMKQFPFESTLQMMSVLTKKLHQNDMVVYTKGSPEKILTLCSQESKPKDIQDILMQFVMIGKRVLAVATKKLNLKWETINKLQRKDIESNLNFLGLIIFENTLKPASEGVINTLKDANIRTIMATGDNMYTAASVARKVNIIEKKQDLVRIEVDENSVLHYTKLEQQDCLTCSNGTEDALTYCHILTGNTYMRIREIYPDLIHDILLSGNVFTRMEPDHKIKLIEDLKQVGYRVGMCGDGANDCGALKVADVGIALSNAEASVVAPFTSKVFDISCVPRLLKEGRAALVTSFGLAKFILLFCFVQFISVLILYYVNSNFSDIQFLYAGLITFLTGSLIIQSPPSEHLTPKRPCGRLAHPIFVIGMIVQVLIQLCFQLAIFLYVRKMPWYQSPTHFNAHGQSFITCYENTAVVHVSFFQFTWISLICCPGKPYRVPFYKNYQYVASIFLTLGFTLFLTFYQTGFLYNIFRFVAIPSKSYLVTLLLISLLNVCISYLMEHYILPSKPLKQLSIWIQRKKFTRNKYKLIYRRLKTEEHWAPVT